MPEEKWNHLLETHYLTLFSSLTVRTRAALEKEKEQIFGALQKGLSSFLETLKRKQAETSLPKIEKICLSFLFFSYEQGTPQFRLDAYANENPEQSLLQESLCAEWLTREVPALGEALLAFARQEKKQRILRKAGVFLWELRAVRSLLLFFTAQMKYWLPEFFQEEQLEGLELAESFTLCMGEFFAKQQILFACFPKVDLQQAPFGTSFRFRVWEKAHYQEANFSGVDLSHAVFRCCSFSQVVWKQGVFLDTLFEDCVFVACQWNESMLQGSLFTRCRLQQIEWENSSFSYLLDASRNEDCMVRAAVFDACVLEQASFVNCDLVDCLFLDCREQEVIRKGCVEEERSEGDGFCGTEGG